MKFGCTLLTDLFTGLALPDTLALCESFGGQDALMQYVSRNLDAVELSGVHVDWPTKEALVQAVDYCNKQGLYVTFHGYLPVSGEPEDFFKPYQLVFKSGMQPLYNITVHPFKSKEETIMVLRRICEYADERDYPVRITVENQRYQNEDYAESLCESVAEIASTIDSERIKVCFDFGHQLSGVRKFGEKRDSLSEKFFSLVRQTHIHSLFEGRTHYPLTCGETLLEQNIERLLHYGYDGVFNLELGAGSYADKLDVKDSLVKSVIMLKEVAEKVEQRLNITM